MKQTAVIYARVSSVTDRQDTQRQVQDLLKYAQAQDIEVVHIFEEHISGAKKNEERAILNECLDFCASNSVRFLLLSELSRLGRSTLQVLRSLERLHEAGVSVFIQNRGLYSLQADGKVNPIASILITVLAEMSNIERSNIQYRLNSGRAQYIANGGKLGRKEGYRKPDDQLREEYKNAITLLRKGYSVRAVARLEGVSPTTIQKIKNKFLSMQRGWIDLYWLIQPFFSNRLGKGFRNGYYYLELRADSSSLYILTESFITLLFFMCHVG